MKNNYSLIDLRLIELRQHCIKLILWTAFILFFVLFLIVTIFSLPIKFDIFYKDAIYNFFKILYEVDSSQYFIINLLYLFISLLIISLVIIIQYFVYNKKYQRMYKDIILNELKLMDYVFIDYYSLPSKELERIYNSLKLNIVINENIASLKREHCFFLNHLYLKKKNKEGSLYILLMNDKVKKYINVDTTGNHFITEFESHNIFDFYYDKPKYPNIIRVFSSYGKKTNTIVNNEFIEQINNLQYYFNSKITLSIFDRYIALFVPNQKIELSQSLYKKYRTNLIDDKINTIEHINNKLSNIFQLVIKEGE